MTDFAKAQLLKYGWTEGKGLGKNENGISQAIKPQLKFDKSGFGAKDLDINWWDSVYDKAMKSIVDGFDNSMSDVKKNTIVTSNSTIIEMSKKEHELLYGKFLKTVTLQNGNMIRHSNNQSVIDEAKHNPIFVQMSDEELFKACGHRTAHKGARHGLSLTGKLTRIAEQEKQFAAASFLKSNKKNIFCCKKKRKKEEKKRKCMDVEDFVSELNGDYTFNSINCPVIPLQLQSKIECKPSKTSRSKVKKKIQCLSDQLTKSCIIQDDFIDSKQTEKKIRKINKCKKKYKQKVIRNIQNSEIHVDHDLNMQQCMKKSNKSNEINDGISNDIEINEYKTNDMLQKSNRRKNNHALKKVKSCKYKHSKATEADRKNKKIKLKKIKKHERKEKKSLKKLTKSLLAFSLQQKDLTTKTMYKVVSSKTDTCN